MVRIPECRNFLQPKTDDTLTALFTLPKAVFRDVCISVTVYGFKGLPAFGGAVGDQGSGLRPALARLPGGMRDTGYTRSGPGVRLMKGYGSHGPIIYVYFQRPKVIRVLIILWGRMEVKHIGPYLKTCPLNDDCLCRYERHFQRGSIIPLEGWSFADD
jgi:hypothetical protein